MKILYFGYSKASKMVFAAFMAVVISLVAAKYATYDNRGEIDTVSLTNLAGKIVVIDPSHGGIDDGASFHDIDEKSMCDTFLGR